jgi:NitT/TauT family transport system ATP-binding protein
MSDHRPSSPDDIAGGSSAPKLDVRGVSLSYLQPRTGRTFEVLRNVDLRISTGEFLSVVGPSGCGKTTFLNVVGGMLAATSGDISVDDRPVTAPGPDRAVVFQDASLLPWRTVMNNVLYGLECQGVPRVEARARSRRFIELVGLTDFEEHYPHELSGGMQQRVNLARALVMDPEILLMDEPFASLDAQTRETMQEELLEIWQRTNKTVLFITHQIDEAIYLSDRVIVFSRCPASVKASIGIDIERPRRLSLKRERRFHEVEDRIWTLIEEEAKREKLRWDKVTTEPDFKHGQRV